MDFQEISRRMLKEDGFHREPDDCSRRWESHRGQPTKAQPRWSKKEKSKLKELATMNLTWETIALKVSDMENIDRSATTCERYYKKRIVDKQSDDKDDDKDDDEDDDK